MKAVSSALCKIIGCDSLNKEEVDNLNNKIKQKQCELDECIINSHDLNSKIVDLKFKSDKANEDNAYLRNSLLTIANERDALIVKLGANNERLNSLTLELVELKKKLPVVDEMETFYNNKYSKATVVYKSRNFGITKEMVPTDVRNFLTPNDAYIQSFIKSNNLQIVDPETDVPKIYNFIKQFYKYKDEQSNFGIPELWLFCWESLYNLRLSGGQDCDDYAILQSNAMMAAGLPYWKVRLVAGDCKFGGHLTVYVYSDVTKRFHHLNSTYNGSSSPSPGKISEYPKSGDASDSMGISKPWFGWNSLYAYVQWDAPGTAVSFEKYGSDKFEIYEYDVLLSTRDSKVKTRKRRKK